MEGDFEGKESVDDCETLLDKLRSQKRVCKMQLTKLYSRLLRLMSGEVTDVEELLTALEATQEKNLDVLQVLEDLIVIYQSKGDEQSLKRAEAEMEKVTTDTDREIAMVKEFFTSLTLKASPMNDAEFQGDPLEKNVSLFFLAFRSASVSLNKKLTWRQFWMWLLHVINQSNLRNCKLTGPLSEKLLYVLTGKKLIYFSADSRRIVIYIC